MINNDNLNYCENFVKTLLKIKIFLTRHINIEKLKKQNKYTKR